MTYARSDVTRVTYGVAIAHSSGLSNSGELQRVMNAARTPEWSFGLDRRGRIMATRDSGEIGLPWVVLAERAGRGLRVSLFHPGDDTQVEGEVIGDVVGSPREKGRQLREILTHWAERQ